MEIAVTSSRRKHGELSVTLHEQLHGPAARSTFTRYSRNGNDFTDRYASITKAFSALKGHPAIEAGKHCAD